MEDRDPRRDGQDASFGRHYHTEYDPFPNRDKDLIDRDDLFLRLVLIVVAGAVAIGTGATVLDIALTKAGF